MNNDHHHERRLLACVMLDPSLLLTIIESGVQYDWFQHRVLRDLFQAMIKYYNKGYEPNMVWATEYLQKKTGKNYAVEISSEFGSILTPRNEMLSAIEILKQRYERNQLQQILTDTQKKLYTDEPQILIDRMVSELNNRKSVNRTSREERQANVMSEIIASLNRGIEYPTGYAKLDFQTKGIERGVKWTIGAFTSNGKTALAMNIAKRIAGKGNEVTLFSTEMTEKQMTERFAVMQSGINKDYQTSITQAEKQAYREGVNIIQDLPLYFSETTSLSDIRITIRKKSSLLYIIDYIQDIRPDYPIRNENERMTYIAQELHRLAKEYNVCIIEISQFSRPQDKDKHNTPSLFYYRGSSAIEHKTDVGILMYYPYQQALTEEHKKKLKDEGKDKIINIRIGKNRIHPIIGNGIIKMELDHKTMRMKEVEQ
jgi:replicative DNA helicase